MFNPSVLDSSICVSGYPTEIQAVQELTKFQIRNELLNNSEIKNSRATSRNSDIGLNAVQLVQKYGYPIEDHQDIRTDDDYLLNIHRIPHGRNNSHVPGKPPVLLIQGLLCNSADWINMGPSKSLGYILADKGYDVWMGNNRGTTWSRKHIKFNPDDKLDAKYWEFSFDEMGYYDVPAMIDYVLKITGQKKVHIVGHSQGTIITFIMLSERPEYNEKVKLVTALAPAAFMSNIKSTVARIIAKNMRYLTPICKYLGWNEILPKSKLFSAISRLYCVDGSPFQQLCAQIFLRIGGGNPNQLNKAMMPVIISNTPAGTSLKNLNHYAQQILSGKFRRFDYGNALENMKRYGSEVPTDYKLKNIKAPLAFYYSEGDLLTTVKDINILVKELSSLMVFNKVPDPKWGHLDFIWGIDAPTVIFDQAIQVMDEY